MDNEKYYNSLNKEIGVIKHEVSNINVKLKAEFKSDIDYLKDRYNTYIQEQKNENSKIRREITLIEKENIELQNLIYYYLGLLNKIEKDVGLKSKGYTYYFDANIMGSGIDNKIVIEREDI